MSPLLHKIFAAGVVVTIASLVTTCQAQPRPSAQPQNSLFMATAGAALSLGKSTHDIALGDFNNDGKLDLVSVSDGDSVKIHIGDGRGGFSASQTSQTTVAAHLVAVGDVNKDRNLDLALTHHDSFSVVVLLGSGNGRFTPAPGSPFAAHAENRAHNHGITLSDVSGDGNLDITTSNQDDNSVSVLLGNGRGSFSPAAGSPFRVGRAPYPHAVGDLNKDGKPDIATPNVSADSVSVLLGDGRGRFAQAARSPFTVAFRPYYITIGDVNGDGNQDLVTTHDDIDMMTTLLGDGRGGFAAAPGSPFDLGSRGYELAAADVNGDARIDLVVTTMTADSIIVLLSNERGGYTHAAGSPYRADPNPRIAIGDVNGDGRGDIVAAGNESGSVSVLLRK